MRARSASVLRPALVGMGEVPDARLERHDLRGKGQKFREDPKAQKEVAVSTKLTQAEEAVLDVQTGRTQELRHVGQLRVGQLAAAAAPDPPD